MPTRTWDETDPADVDLAKYGAQEVREFKTDIRERLDIEHYFTVGGTEAYHGIHQIPVVTKTADYTATVLDALILCDASGGSFTITLPAAATIPGKRMLVKKIDSSVNAVIVDPNGGETIDGQTDVNLLSRYQTLELISDGTNWISVSSLNNVDFRGALVKKTAVQSISNNTWTAATWTTTLYDTDSIWSIANSERLTVPAGVKKAKIHTVLRFPAFATGVFGASIYHASSAGIKWYVTQTRNTTASTFAQVLNVASPVLPVVAGDYFMVEVYQSSGGAINLEADSSRFGMEIKHL